MALFTEEDICYRKKISQIHDSRLNLIHVYNRLGTMHTAHKKQCTLHRCISLHSKYKRNLPLKQCCGVVGSSDQLFVYFVTIFCCLKHDFYQKEICSWNQKLVLSFYKEIFLWPKKSVSIFCCL